MVVKTRTPRSEPIDGAPAAGEQRAADDRGGDRVQLVEVAVAACEPVVACEVSIMAAMPQHSPDSA